MTKITRRRAIAGVAAGGVASVIAPSNAAAPATVRAYSANHVAKPLSFDPTKLVGLSERLIRSHWENNYQGSVKALNLIEGRLAQALADPDFPPVVFGGLKREHLHRTGSVILHELYFGNLGGGSAVTGAIAESIALHWGSLAVWEADFRKTAMSLAGGSGWCVLSYNPHTQSLGNFWAWDHMHQPVAGVPLLVLDMYEHSFHLDYGAQASRYVDAFMQNVNWAVVGQRYRNATRA